jgi:CspA family cold shock protein
MKEHSFALGPAGVEIRRRDPLVQSYELGDGISAVPTLPDSILALADDLPDLALWLVTMRRGDFNQYDWDRSVRRDLELALKAILLAVPFSCPWFVYLSWGDSEISSKLQIEQRFLHTANLPGSLAPSVGIRVGMAELRKARDVLGGLQVIFSSRSFMRIRRGLRAFYHGLQEELVEDRLHEFVRSLEAVINPKIGNTTRQFRHRLQVFAGSGQDVSTVLKECYEIRSKVEHLQSPSTVLQHIPTRRRSAYIYLHTRRLEALCRHIYGRMASSLRHLALFEDTTIDEFWDKNQAEQCALWGEPLKSFTGTPWKEEMKNVVRGVHIDIDTVKTTGVVKWFNAEKGYGFISHHDGSSDIFVHYTVIEGTGGGALREGQKVEFELAKGQKGRVATHVRVVG